MRAPQKTFIVAYASFVFATVVVLGFLSEIRLDVYVALFIVQYFLASEFIYTLRTRSPWRQVINIVMVSVFGLIVFGRILEILSQM